jgi:hypothetical protein
MKTEKNIEVKKSVTGKIKEWHITTENKRLVEMKLMGKNTEENNKAKNTDDALGTVR